MNNQNYNFLKIISSALTDKIYELDNPDFEGLIRLSFEQNLTPIFLEGISKYDCSKKAPISSMARLIECASASVAVQSQKTAAFCDIYNQLTSVGLKPIILKGFVCRICYGKYENLRCSGDEDIFIKKEDYGLCKKILELNGFHTCIKDTSDRVLSNIHTINFESEKSLLKIEIHFDFIGRQSSFSSCINELLLNSADELSVFEYGGKVYYSLDYTFNFMFLFFHFYKHFISSGAGIRNVIDIGVFANKYKKKIDFTFAENIITKYVGTAFYADTLYIASIIGFPIFTEIIIKNPDMLCDDLLDGGSFGFSNPEKFYANTYVSIKGNDKSKFPLLRFVFPSYTTMANVFPELHEKPIKLPIYYYIRIKNYYKNKRNPVLERNIFRNSKSRIRLIKSYTKSK